MQTKQMLCGQLCCHIWRRGKAISKDTMREGRGRHNTLVVATTCNRYYQNNCHFHYHHQTLPSQQSKLCIYIYIWRFCVVHSVRGCDLHCRRKLYLGTHLVVFGGILMVDKSWTDKLNEPHKIAHIIIM